MFQKVLWQCAKKMFQKIGSVPNFFVFFFVGLGGHFSHWHCITRFVHKARSASRCSLCSRPLQQIIEMTLYVTSQIKWAESQHETDARIHTVNSKSINVDMRVFKKILIPAKAPATQVVWLKSRILLTYYHDKIGARILLEVPEKCQSPHTHTRRRSLL